jgi:glycosyltransferase involved in cell wall biosynthesis
MRIGLIAPPWVPVPPRTYGGTELVVDNLARGLAWLGHDVRLFTLGESTCPVHREYLFAAPARPMGLAVSEAAHVLAAYAALHDVDVIHDHTVLGGLVGASREHRRPPVVVTHHGVFDLAARRVFDSVTRHADLVAISASHARQAGPIPVTAVIHHGLDLPVYRPTPPARDAPLLFLGRMSEDKGVHRAIAIARAAGRQLLVISKMREQAEREYYDDVVRPLLGPDVELLIEPSVETRLAALAHAAALVNPITWPEPFGLVMAEALASGTPVLAFPWGAAPEIVEDGVTGFLREDVAGLVEGVSRLAEIDRATCRRVAEERFSLQRMATDYLSVYRRAIAEHAVLTGVSRRRRAGARSPQRAAGGTNSVSDNRTPA